MDNALSVNRAISHFCDDKIAMFRKDPMYQAVMLDLLGAGVLTEEQFRIIFATGAPKYVPGKLMSKFKSADIAVC